MTTTVKLRTQGLFFSFTYENERIPRIGVGDGDAMSLDYLVVVDVAMDLGKKPETRINGVDNNQGLVGIVFFVTIFHSSRGQ